MEAILITIAQYFLAALLGVGSLKGGEYAINKYRGAKEDPPEVSATVCRMKHEALDTRFNAISEDIEEIKAALKTLIDLQMQLISLRGDLKDAIDIKIDRHESRYHAP